MWGRRRLSEEEKAANAAARAERAKAAMTCQVCARAILANKGHIAHHGYQRPGDGWQTESCGGAKELPFEVSRDALGVEIAHARAYVEATRKTAASVAAEETPVSWTYQVLEGEGVIKRFVPRAIGGVTRDNFEALKAEKPEAFKDQHGDYERGKGQHAPFIFELARDRLIASLTYQAERTEAYANQQQKRFDGWKQTHERRDARWVKIARRKK